MVSIGNVWLWSVFSVVVIVMIAMDFLLMGRGKSHQVSLKEAASWSTAWVLVSLLFALGLWYYLDVSQSRVLANDTGMKFITAYVLEKSLAVDNVFVWMIIFNAFKVSGALQKRVLFYGIMGALLFRTIMIFGGTWLIQHFDWLLYVFGLFLIFIGIKMLLPEKPNAEHLDDAFISRFLRRHMRISDALQGERFFIREKGLRYATPLFLCLIVVEFSDIVFAVDSIPAVFAVTTDPFIVLTSNIFAILGLRAMYFLLAGTADKLALLKYGLAVIMGFIGLKMLLEPWLHVPVVLSLAIILGVLLITVLLNVWWNRRMRI